MSGAEMRAVPGSGADIGVRPCGNRAPEPVLPAPGPWVLNMPGFGSGYCVVTAADGRPVAAAMTGGHERPFTADQVRLHGRMVQAAPEIYELAERLVGHLLHPSHVFDTDAIRSFCAGHASTLMPMAKLLRDVREGA